MIGCTVLVDDDNLCGEAPIWDAQQKNLYWTDCLRSKFFSYDWTTKKREVILENFEVNGCALNRGDGFVFVNNSGVWLWDRSRSPILLAAELDDIKLQLNDCIADSKGRLLAGSCFYMPAQEFALGHLVCVETDGKIRILDEGFHLANGICFSPDQKTLYFADSVERTIYAYAYDSTNASVAHRRVFAKLDRNAGLPDGLTVDAEGFLWSAEWYGSCIARYDPDGKLERRIAIPAKQVSSLAFGGPELTDIFVTSAGKSEPMPVMPPRYDPASGYCGGALFGLNLDIQGLTENRVDISLGSK